MGVTLTPVAPVDMVVELPTDKPSPEPEPMPGWKPGPGERPFRVGPNKYDGPLLYSNATVVAHQLLDGRVVPGKVKVNLNSRHDHMRRIEELNNYRWLYKFIQPLTGWCDPGGAPEGGRIPYQDDVPYECSIDCDHNLRNATQILVISGNKYVVTQTQDFNSPPVNKNYLEAPQLHTKQVLSNNLQRPELWMTSNFGDVSWPWTSPVPVVHHLYNCRFYPGYQDTSILTWIVTTYKTLLSRITGAETLIASPFSSFDCKIQGFKAHVVGYKFRGSETWAQVDGGELESGWYLADGYPYVDRQPPELGTSREYVCNISDVKWPKISPPMAWYLKE